MRVLPCELRNLLKEPVGILVNEEELIKILGDNRLIVTVGDFVTYTLLKHGIKPLFCIVDYRTRRGKFPLEYVKIIKSFGEKVIVVENPKGTITEKLWQAIVVAFDNANDCISTRIEVEGEEDLASLAVLSLAPKDVTIIYGLPDKGILVVKPIPEIKEKVKKVLDKMSE
jgi:uncharacterized protein (UPF0218 family)